EKYARERLLRGRRGVTRRPAELLEIARAVAHLDRAKLVDTTDRSHRLNPAAVEAGRDAIDFVKRVVAVFLGPQRAAQRIEVHAETVADAVSEDLFDV